MPVNPLQRRLRNSFLGGFLVALIIMGLVVFALITKIKTVEDEKAKLIAMQQMMYVAVDDIKSGDTVTMDSFVLQKVQSNVDPSQVVSEDDFYFKDEYGEIVIKYNKDGSEKQKEMIMKIDIPAGTIITKEMLAESTADISDDLRIQEFNMIVLPSQLIEGEYIDIRLSLPRGQDYIVLSKKKVLQATETGVWLQLSEEEILTMNNAIVESYTIDGSKLYALPYTQPGIQGELEPTYPVSAEVLQLIMSDPNVIEDAKNALYGRYIANEQAQAIQRNTVIGPAVAENAATMNTDVQTKNQEEISKIQEARADYVNSLGQ